MNASAQPGGPFQDNGRAALPPDQNSPSVLSTGLQLVRASTLASTRLQLALARRDRRQAMAALDGLIDIDGEIERFVAELPVPDSIQPDWSALTDHLSEQKAAIASEKFSLACGIAGPGLVPAADPVAERNAAGQVSQPPPEPVTGHIILEPDSPASIFHLGWIIALLTFAAAALAVAAWLYLDGAGVDVESFISG